MKITSSQKALKSAKSLSLSLSLVAQSCLSFVIPWTVACEAPLSMGFSRQEYKSGLPFPSPGDLPDPKIKLVSYISRQAFHPSATWEAHGLCQWIV